MAKLQFHFLKLQYSQVFYENIKTEIACVLDSGLLIKQKVSLCSFFYLFLLFYRLNN